MTENATATPTPRQQLYDVRDDDGLSPDETIERALAVGCEFLGVEHGHVSRHDDGDDSFSVLASVGAGDRDPIVAPDEHLAAATTYCRRTVEGDLPVAIADAPAEGWGADPAYEATGLACYLGAPITVDGDPFGTVCFLAPDAREDSFSADERSFVELIARTVERVLEHRRYEAELAETERAKRQSTEKYRSLVSTAPDAIFLIDADRGVVTEVNEAAADLVGTTVADAVDRPMTAFHPDEHAAYLDELLAKFEAGIQAECRYDDGTPFLLERLDGGTVPVEISVNAVDLPGGRYLQGIMRDISDRRERERELRVKSRAVEAAEIGVTIADATDPDDAIVYANRAFGELTGYDRQDIRGRNCRMLQGPDTDPESVATLREGIAAEEPVQTTLRNYRKDGTPFWNEVSITPVADETGETTHFVGFQRDVTRREQREQVISVLNRVLRHNIRNDMTLVAGIATELATDLDGERAARARQIAETATELTDLSEDARSLERMVRKSEPPGPASLDAAFERVAAEIAESHPDATVTVPDADGGTILGTAYVADALAELADTLLTRAETERRIAFELADADDHVSIRVHDDGTGLAADDLAVLRDGRETQLDHVSGLSLWLVKWTVDACGGDVTFHEDEVDAVATIRFRRPE